MDEDYGSETVQLYIYDMTKGLASMMSPLLLGKYLHKIRIFLIFFIFTFDVIKGRRIDGVWHTSVVVFHREYFFGSHGISSISPVSYDLYFFLLIIIIFSPWIW